MQEVEQRGLAMEQRLGKPVIYAQVYITGLEQKTLTIVCPFSAELPKEDLARMVPKIVEDAIADLFEQKPPSWIS
jgi:hypothetical protein